MGSILYSEIRINLSLFFGDGIFSLSLSLSFSFSIFDLFIIFVFDCFNLEIEVPLLF